MLLWVFCLVFRTVKLKSFKLVPVLIATVTIGLTCFFQSDFFNRRFDFLQQIEWRTYDQRVKVAKKYPHEVATNLAAVFLDEITLKTLDASWPYPRQLHGRLVRELAAEGAKAVGFDVLFGELRPDDDFVFLPDKSLIGSDAFFAMQMGKAGNVVLAGESQVFPPPLFANNAMAVGNILASPDSDGTLRRAKAFVDEPEHGRLLALGILLAVEQLGWI